MVIVIMGVSGSGKTTIGEALSSALHWRFRDADEFHPAANIEKMRQGIPLNDDDRRPWLEALRHAIEEAHHTNANLILACSALKGSYRDFLGEQSDQVKFIFLNGSFDLIEQRLKQRKGHYMKANLLKSQFDALEEPKDAIAVEIDQSPAAITQQIRTRLHL